MAKPRAILKHAQAIRNIAKITNTMQMIATARFKQAYKRAAAARPYTDRLTKLIAELTEAAAGYSHPLLESREPRRAAVLALASNRGLCGGYNTNIARELHNLSTSLTGHGLDLEIHVAGKKLADMLRFRKVSLASVLTHVEGRITFADVDAVATPFLARFEAGEIDEFYVVYTKFLSSARQRPVVERVLPLGRTGNAEGEIEDKAEGRTKVDPEYIFSPDAETILRSLLPRGARLHVFQAVLDAMVSEQTARMVAMKAATDNARDMITDLTRKYNRTRQTQITTELNEIMGGAVALE